MFHIGHTTVRMKPGSKLSRSRIDRGHVAGALLQEAICKPAGGCTDIKAVPPCGVDTERIKRSLQLVAAAPTNARFP